MQYFAEQDTTLSLRASQYRKKRKTGLQPPEDDSESSPPPQAKQGTAWTAQSHASSTSPELAQLRVAGLLPGDEDEIPPTPFPHAYPKISKDHYGPAKVEEDMAKAPARLFAVTAASKSDSRDGRADGTSLRRTHLSVLSTIMHRCLLEQDYQRAGRAFGMILRTQVAGGNPVDPRNHGRWGIGAEILLHRRFPSASLGGDGDDHDAGVPDVNASSMFSEAGFELAKEYYERLIVQHPNRKTHPHAIDERTFYPAMFSLWIFQVSEKSKHARNTIQSRRRASVHDQQENDPHDTVAQEAAIRTEELAQAVEIADRIDRLIASPPFDKQSSLLHLRGHVGLWISDLTIGETPLDEDWDMETSMESEIDHQTATDQLSRLNNGQRELVNAQDILLRAEATGTRLETATMTSISIRLKAITHQIAKIRSTQDESL